MSIIKGVMDIKEIIHPIRKDFLSGMSFASIGVKYSIDQRTAKRYAVNNLPLEYLENRHFNSVLDPNKEMIDQWLVNGRVFASTIHDRLTELGCECGYTIVNDYVRKKIDEYEKNGVYNQNTIIKKDELSHLEKAKEEIIEMTKRKGNENVNCS